MMNLKCPLDPKRLGELMTTHLLDPKGGRDRMADRLMGTDRLLARWWVIASWLKVLKVVSPSYMNLSMLSDAEIKLRIEIIPLRNLYYDDINLFSIFN